jgi:hypothetical protein
MCGMMQGTLSRPGNSWEDAGAEAAQALSKKNDGLGKELLRKFRDKSISSSP